MYPEIQIANAHIGTYGLMVAVGAIALILMASHLEKLRGYLPFDYISSLGWVASFALAGSVLVFAISNIPYLTSVLFSIGSYENTLDFLEALLAAFQGMVFYGGMLGALLGYWIWLKRSGRPKGDYWDMFAVCLPLFHGFARIGCFLGGCCYGVECDFGITYTISRVDISNGVPRFPVQLLESALEFALFGALYILYRKRSAQSQLIWIWAIAYPTIRFFDEFLRGDYYRGFFGPFSTSQWISLILLCIAVSHFVKKHHSSRKGREQDPLQKTKA